MRRILLRLLKRVRNSFLWIWYQQGSPAERARGLAVGVFSGCFPLFGFQSLLGLGLASLFKGNHLLAIAGTWISNPFTYIPLYWFNYKVGAFCLGNDTQLHKWEGFFQTQIWNQGWKISSRILLGSGIVGLFSGLAIGVAFYILFKALSNKNTVI